MWEWRIPVHEREYWVCVDLLQVGHQSKQGLRILSLAHDYHLISFVSVTKLRVFVPISGTGFDQFRVL